MIGKLSSNAIMLLTYLEIPSFSHVGNTVHMIFCGFPHSSRQMPGDFYNFTQLFPSTSFSGSLSIGSMRYELVTVSLIYPKIPV
jgi:hypothetical protein